jgi:hypothetical protein
MVSIYVGVECVLTQCLFVSVPRIQQWSLKEFPLVGIICCFGSTHRREIESDNF